MLLLRSLTLSLAPTYNLGQRSAPRFGATANRSPARKGAQAMAVEVTSEEQMMLDMVRDLVREKGAPRAAETDAKGEFPWHIKRLLAKQDILAMPLPEA